MFFVVALLLKFTTQLRFPISVYVENIQILTQSWMHELFNFLLPPEKQTLTIFYAIDIPSQSFGKLKYT